MTIVPQNALMVNNRYYLSQVQMAEWNGLELQTEQNAGLIPFYKPDISYSKLTAPTKAWSPSRFSGHIIVGISKLMIEEDKVIEEYIKLLFQLISENLTLNKL